jgi:membrane protein required for colicin V production
MILTTLDWIFIALLGLSVVLGFWRGVIWEVMSLGGWFVAGFAAIYGSDFLSPHLSMTGLSDTLRYALAFLLIFIAALIVWSMLTSVIKNAVGAIGLGALDRLLGGIFGLGRGALILTFAVSLISYTPVDSAEFWQTSTAVKLCKAAAQSLKPYLPARTAGLIPSTF